MFETNKPIPGMDTEQAVKTKVAYINDTPFPFVPGETILSFIRRSLGENLVPTLCSGYRMAGSWIGTNNHNGIGIF